MQTYQIQTRVHALDETTSERSARAVLCSSLTGTQEATHLLKQDKVLRLTNKFFESACYLALLRLLCGHVRVLYVLLFFLFHVIQRNMVAVSESIK
jgi:hypothetical protein